MKRTFTEALIETTEEQPFKALKEDASSFREEEILQSQTSKDPYYADPFVLGGEEEWDDYESNPDYEYTWHFPEEDPNDFPRPPPCKTLGEVRISKLEKWVYDELLVLYENKAEFGRIPNPAAHNMTLTKMQVMAIAEVFDFDAWKLRNNIYSISFTTGTIRLLTRGLKGTTHYVEKYINIWD